MKFCALISGGKDSFSAIQKATSLRCGSHELVCAAHLTPPPKTCSDGDGESGDNELDSFMYQSAASSVIPALTIECLGVPLVMRTIRGASLNVDLVYTHKVSETAPKESDSYDEVEDLYMLLEDVKRLFPEVEGVTCGAILSTYQRTRLEHVCGRLGLTPLCYLWRAAPQHELLNTIIGDGVDAIVVKTAAMGLTPHRHLGKHLAMLEPYFSKLHDQHQFHVCGEGGEYESLVVDCPLFRRRLVIDNADVVQDDSEGSDNDVGWLHIRQFHTEVKEGQNSADQNVSQVYRFDFAQEKDVHKDERKCDQDESEECIAAQSSQHEEQHEVPHHTIQRGGLVHVSQLASNISSPTESPKVEFETILRQLSLILNSVGATPQDVVMVHLYLRQMKLFASLNQLYQAFFGSVLPPSRVCIAMADHQQVRGASIVLDCTIQVRSGAAQRPMTSSEQQRALECMTVSSQSGIRLRHTLHVQSRSCWAPTCVGPYSQCNTVRDCILYVAGQIGLDPPTMSFTDRQKSWQQQLRQSWSNAASVLDALGDESTRTAGSLKTQVLGGVVYVASTHSKAPNVWTEMAEISKTLVHTNGDVTAGNIDGFCDRDGEVDDLDGYEDEETRLAIEGDRVGVEPFVDAPLPPLIYVAVPQMPVNAESEVELICLSSRCSSCLTLETEPVRETRCLLGEGPTLEFAIRSSLRYVRGCCAMLCLTGSCSPAHESDNSAYQRMLAKQIVLLIKEAADTSDLDVISHVGRIRVHYDVARFAQLSPSDMHPSTLQSLLREAFISLVTDTAPEVADAYEAATTSIPAITVVPVDGISDDAAVAVSVELLDLVHMETELWIKHNRLYFN
jgi:diphthine-ammonia ligase